MTEDFRFAHIGVAVAQIEPALRHYQDILGYQLISGPFDDPIQRVRVCFIKRPNPEHDPQVELIAPLDDKSPIQRVLSAGGGAYHICYEVNDIEKTLATCRSKGCLIVSQPVPAVAFGGRKIAWMYLPSRQLVELLQSEGATV